MRRHAGYGAVERIAYNNDIDKDIYEESFPTRAGKDFYAIKRILRMAPSGTMEITRGLVLMKNRG